MTGYGTQGTLSSSGGHRLTAERQRQRRRGLIVSGLLLGIVSLAAVVAMLAGGSSAPTARAQNLSSGFVVLSPDRILDTRDTGTLAGGQQITVATGIRDAGAAAINLTMTNTEGWGFLTAWASGSRPNTSVINVDDANQTVANYVVVPMTSDGTFELWTFAGTDVLVDLMGYYTGSDAPAPAPSTHGVSAEITGYGPGFSITEVSGTATNTSARERSVRIDVTCPDGTVETRSVFGITPGQTRGWSVLCDDVFTTGASIARVVEI